MKSVFDPAVRAELTARINSVSDSNKALWGKMNAFQMVKHCTLSEDMMLGKVVFKRVFIGYLIGRMIFRKVIKDESPFSKNSPTSPHIKTLGEKGDIEKQKQEWIQRLAQYEKYEPHFVHPFFGPMNKEQLGIFAYKHSDHHLRQFGA